MANVSSSSVLTDFWLKLQKTLFLTISLRKNVINRRTWKLLDTLLPFKKYCTWSADNEDMKDSQSDRRTMTCKCRVKPIAIVKHAIADNETFDSSSPEVGTSHFFDTYRQDNQSWKCWRHERSLHCVGYVVRSEIGSGAPRLIWASVLPSSILSIVYFLF